jgi:hypothetical protein
VSYDIHLEIDAGGPEPAQVGRDLNYTRNVSPMWRKALQGATIPTVADMHGRLASECLPALDHAIAAMLDDPPTYDAMNPPNGWGNADGARKFLEEIAGECRAHPKATIRVSR